MPKTPEGDSPSTEPGSTPSSGVRGVSPDEVPEPSSRPVIPPPPPSTPVPTPRKAAPPSPPTIYPPEDDLTSDEETAEEPGPTLVAAADDVGPTLVASQPERDAVEAPSPPAAEPASSDATPPPAPAPAPVVSTSDKPDVPKAIQTAAIVQMVTGFLDMTVMAMVSAISIYVLGLFGGSVISVVLTVLTLGLCPLTLFGPFLAFCGVIGLALVPLGILELVAGLLALIDPVKNHKFMRYASYVMPFGILAGGITSLIGGIVVLMLLRDPEAQAFMAEHS